MLRNLDSSGLYYEGSIDDRNQRPLTIALATIVAAWMVVFGLVAVRLMSARCHTSHTMWRRAPLRSKSDRQAKGVDWAANRPAPSEPVKAWG